MFAVMRPALIRMFLACGLVAAALAAVLVAGQAPTFRSRVLTVEVHATVRGPDGLLVTGLTKDDFELFDNGKRRDITVFSADVQPIAVALLLDRSGSVARQAEKITAAAETFVRALLPADRAALHSLSYECLPLTDDKTQLFSMLKSPMQTDFGSPVWSGLDRTMTSLAGVTGRRAILLFSDGEDAGPQSLMPSVTGTMPGPCTLWRNPSEASLTDASKRAQREGIMVYTVSVESTSGMSRDADLRGIARGSGGERYRLKQESELGAAFASIVDELHHQYLLGFVPEALDGKVHALSVRVKRPGVSVRGRESYVAIDLDAPAAGPNAAAAPRPVTAADIDRAIRDGASGNRLQASCMAFGTFPGRPPPSPGEPARPNENEADVFAEVVLEGPTGRIMRAARDAKAQRTTFTAANVTDAMRAPVVSVTAELKRTLRPIDSQLIDPAATPTPTPTPAPTPSPRPIVPPRGVTSVDPMLAVTSVRLRSRLLTEVMLRPLPAGPADAPVLAPPRILFSSSRVELFDLAAFHGLPGSDVEVVVRSPTGPRYCSITAKDRAAIR